MSDDGIFSVLRRLSLSLSHVEITEELFKKIVPKLKTKLKKSIYCAWDL